MGLGPLEALRHWASRGSPSERCVSTACRAGRSAEALTSGRRCRSRGRLEALRLVAQSWDRAGIVAQIASVVASRGFSNLLSWGHHYRWDPCCFVADLADLCTGEPVCPVPKVWRSVRRHIITCCCNKCHLTRVRSSTCYFRG